MTCRLWPCRQIHRLHLRHPLRLHLARQRYLIDVVGGRYAVSAAFPLIRGRATLSRVGCHVGCMAGRDAGCNVVKRRHAHSGLDNNRHSFRFCGAFPSMRNCAKTHRLHLCPDDSVACWLRFGRPRQRQIIHKLPRRIGVDAVGHPYALGD